MGESALGKLIAVRFDKKIYVKGSVLTRVYDPEVVSKPEVMRKALVHSAVETTSLDVPHVLGVRQVDGRWAIDLDFIEGETLEDRMYREPERAGEHIDQLVRLQLEVLSQSPAFIEDLKDRLNRRISALGRIDDESKRIDAPIRYELHVALDKMPAHRKLCHGDFLPDNIVFSPEGKPYIFDWTHASVGDAGADAARTYLKMNIEGHSDWAELYLQRFCQLSGDSEEYVRSWFPMVSASMLAKASTPESVAYLRKNIDEIEFE